MTVRSSAICRIFSLSDLAGIEDVQAGEKQPQGEGKEQFQVKGEMIGIVNGAAQKPRDVFVGHEKKEKFLVALAELQQGENRLRHAGNERRCRK